MAGTVSDNGPGRRRRCERRSHGHDADAARVAMTRRQLLVGAAFGAVATVLCGGCGEERLPAPHPLTVPGGGGAHAYLRGINSYTLNYASRREPRPLTAISRRGGIGSSGCHSNGARCSAASAAHSTSRSSAS